MRLTHTFTAPTLSSTVYIFSTNATLNGSVGIIILCSNILQYLYYKLTILVLNADGGFTEEISSTIFIFIAIKQFTTTFNINWEYTYCEAFFILRSLIIRVSVDTLCRGGAGQISRERVQNGSLVRSRATNKASKTHRRHSQACL